MRFRLARRLPGSSSPLGFSSFMSSCTQTIAAAPSTKAAPKAARMPATRPSAPISTPPSTGPSAMGMRRTKECTVTPMVRFAVRHDLRDHAHDRGQR